MFARRNSVGKQKQVLDQQARQASARIGGYEAQLAANREQRKSVEQELVGMRSLAEKGFASMTRIRQLERASAAIEGEVGTFTAQIAEARESMGQSRMQALVIDSTTVQEIDQRLREVAARINEIAPQQTAANERLASTVLRAPASGRIVNLAVFTVGGVIAPGQTLMEVVPDVVFRQGMTENSNVEIGEEMVAMMATLRQSEGGARLVQVYDDLLGRALSTLGQSGK